jgi:hypothetical protein
MVMWYPAKSAVMFSVVFIIAMLKSDHAHALDLTPTDRPFQYQAALPNHTYHKYCKNIYSQNGEDGILEQLLKELGIKSGTFCEFGAANGIESSNTYNLIKNYNFSGVAIELDRLSYEKCLKNYAVFSNVRVYHGAVLYNDAHNNLNAWLKRGKLPYDLDLLSIDIDYDDYYVWENLTEFMPKIVIVETNSYRDPIYEELPGKSSKEYNIDLLRQWHAPRVAQGCSFISAVKLGLQKGYIPVAYTGNITFVRRDLVYLLKDFPYILSNDPYDYVTLYSHLTLWKNSWMTNTGLILNVAIRDYYLKFKKKHIDIDWLNVRMHQILRNENVIF